MAPHAEPLAVSPLCEQSDKPILDYSSDVWRDQVCAFVKDVIKDDVVVAGNSLGGYTALAAATHLPGMIQVCKLR